MGFHYRYAQSDRGVNSDGMTGDEYWAAILEAALL